jgi:hypothetical protein
MAWQNGLTHVAREVARTDRENDVLIEAFGVAAPKAFYLNIPLNSIFYY